MARFNAQVERFYILEYFSRKRRKMLLDFRELLLQIMVIRLYGRLDDRVQVFTSCGFFGEPRPDFSFRLSVLPDYEALVVPVYKPLQVRLGKEMLTYVLGVLLGHFYSVSSLKDSHAPAVKQTVYPSPVLSLCSLNCPCRCRLGAGTDTATDGSCQRAGCSYSRRGRSRGELRPGDTPVDQVREVERGTWRSGSNTRSPWDCIAGTGFAPLRSAANPIG